MYETIASPLALGGVRLKNRIVFAPTTLGLPRRNTRTGCAGSRREAAR